jgi:multidrug efflux pump subunit AcrB
MLVVYGAIVVFGLNEFRLTPLGFIPALDRGYLIAVIQLPPGASLARTDEVNRRAAEIARQVPGVAGAVNVVGFSGATFTNAPNSGALFVVLEPFAQRAHDPRKSASAVLRELYSRFASIQEALIFVVPPPPVQGIGNAGGFRMMIEDRAGRGPQALQEVVGTIMSRAAETPGLSQVFSLFETATPELYLDIDRVKAQMLGIAAPDVFAALQIYIGSIYVNDFNLFGRTFRVTAQAAAPYRTSSTSECATRREVRCRSAPSPRFVTCPGRIASPATTSIRLPSSTVALRPAIRRARRCRSWSGWRTSSCRTASITNGRRSPSSRFAPGIRRRSRSCWR